MSGFGTLYVAPLGTLFPLITDMPESDWIPVGDTVGGTKLTIDQKIVSFSDVQCTAPSKVVRTEESVVFETRLTNATLDVLVELTGLPLLVGTSTKKTGLYQGSTVVPMALLCRMYLHMYSWESRYVADGIDHVFDGDSRVCALIGVAITDSDNVLPRQYELPAGYFDGPIVLEHTKDGQVEVPLRFVALEDRGGLGLITDQTSYPRELGANY